MKNQQKSFRLGAASGFRLEFKGDHQPPAVIPANNEDLRYNVPAMRLMAVEKEIIVRVLNDDGTPYATPTVVTLWSVLATNWPNNPTADDAYPGRLCNLTYHRPTMPYRRWFFEKRKCHEDAVTPETPKGSMQNISVASGDAVFHGLFHTKATENGPRVLAVKATIGGVTKMIATNPIVVHRKYTRIYIVYIELGHFFSLSRSGEATGIGAAAARVDRVEHANEFHRSHYRSSQRRDRVLSDARSRRRSSHRSRRRLVLEVLL